MDASDTFPRFVSEVDELVRRRLSAAEMVQRITPGLEGLVAARGWLGASKSRPVSGKPYSQYLLHLSADGPWSVVSFVWPAGSSTPVHDHGCWGVVGVYQGEETETAFLQLAGDRELGSLSLERAGTRIMRAGDVAGIVPPDDIHQVSNRGEETAISIHVYGADIGAQRRHAFDPASGEVKSFVSGYDRPAS